MNTEITRWLAEGGNYTEGVKLLATVCRNTMLVSALLKKENLYNREKLISELQKHQGITPEVKSEAPPMEFKVVSRIIPSKKPLVPEEESISFVPSGMSKTEISEAVEKIKLGIAKMTDKRGILANSLSNLTSDEERKKVIAQMDDITKSISEARGKIDYFHKHGDLPPLPEPQKQVAATTFSADPNKLRQELNNLRSTRSKLARDLKSDRLAPIKRSEKQAKFDKINADIIEIERRLAHG